MIRVEHLTKQFGAKQIFKEASYTFPNTGFIAILGASGCGKSTFLNLLAGFDCEYEGNICVQDTNIKQLSKVELCEYRRDNIGFIFQNYHLIKGYTALENVLLASDVYGVKMEERAKELLSKVGLLDKMNKKIELLSGGEKQRVAIARALINQPSILLADEPTGALDRKNANEIMQLLKSISEDHLVIMITHDAKCAEWADSILSIEKQKLVGKLYEKQVDIPLVKRASQPIQTSQRARKNFKINFKRNFFIALTLAMSICCLTLSISSKNIMNQSIIEFQQKNTALHNGFIKLDENHKDIIEVLHNDERLTNVYEQYVLEDVLLTYEDKQVTMDTKYPIAKAEASLSYGVMPRRGFFEIALSPSMASKFHRNINELLGEKIQISYQGKQSSVTICGVFNGTYDDFIISSDIEEELYENIDSKPYSISYDVAKFEEIVEVSNEMNINGIESKNAAKQVAAFTTTFKNIKTIFLVISLLIFVVGIVITVTLLNKQQKSRIKEIGLLAALGYSQSSIRQILIKENLWLLLLAIICNVLIYMSINLVMSALSYTIMIKSGQMLLSLVAMGLLLLFINTIVIKQLTNIDPAKALKM